MSLDTGLDATDARSGQRQAPPPQPLPSTGRPPQTKAAKVWFNVWPKLLAVAIGVGIWQAIYLTGWKSETLLEP